MADNVAITAGTGTDIATDDVGGVHYQKIKLFDGSDASTNPLSVNSAGAASVAPKGVVTAGAISGTTSVAASVAGAGHIVIYRSGTFSGTLVTEATIDGTTWFTVSDLKNDSTAATGGTNLTYTDGGGAFTCGGWQQFRVRCSAYTSGTVNITIVAATTPFRPAGLVNQARPSADINLKYVSDVALNTGGWTGGIGVGGLHSEGTAVVSTGNPVRVGAVAMTANPTAVSGSQVVNIRANKVGHPIVQLGQARELVAMQTTTITSSTAETTIVTAIASTFCDISSLVMTNSSATGTLATLKDATAGTTRGVYWIPAGGGVVMNFNVPLPQAAVNNNWTLTLGTSVASVYVSAVYVKHV